MGKALFGNACIMIATIFWGVNYPFTKALIPEWMSANAISCVRLVGGCCLFWLASLFIKTENLDRESLKKAALGGAIGLFGCIFLFVLSLDYGRAIDIAIIMTLPPVFVILMEVIFMGRRPSLWVYAGVVLSFAGAAMVIMGGGSDSGGDDRSLGDFLAIISSCCFALYLVLLAKPSDRYHPLSLLRWVFLFAALPGLFLAPSLLRSPILHTTKLDPWLWIGFILFCPTFISYLLTQPAIRNIGAVLVSLYQYLTPVVAAVAAMFMGIEKPSWHQAAAMAIIVVGMIMTNMGHDRKTSKNRS
ncbi:MAG: EamA family transporter [Desulfovibrio sp.]|nr:EamA family transporter [Desulfovibrio sp.]